MLVYGDDLFCLDKNISDLESISTEIGTRVEIKIEKEISKLCELSLNVVEGENVSITIRGT